MKVSVIIPVYNAVEFLDQSIQSALDQPEVMEVIVIDDGSTDGSYEKLVDWERKEGRVKLLTQPGRERKRAGAARNLGLKVAKYEYIAFLDADDYFLPDRFLYTRQTISRHPEANVIFEAVEIRKDEGSPMEVPRDHILMMEDVEKNKIFEYYLTHRGNYPHPDGLTFKRNLIEKVGFMDENLSQKQDRDFMLRLCLEGDLQLGIGNRIPVAIYRYHRSNTVFDKNEQYRFLYEIHAKWLGKLRNLPVTKLGKMIFLRQYMVSKYDSYNWSKIKKAVLYPINYIRVLVSNINIFKSLTL